MFLKKIMYILCMSHNIRRMIFWIRIFVRRECDKSVFFLFSFFDMASQSLVDMPLPKRKYGFKI